MSNSERQRRFRERNPGYYSRAQRQQRAALYYVQAEAKLAALRKTADMIAATAFAAEFAAIKPMPLMLPAPTKLPIFDWLSQPQREAEPIPLTVPPIREAA